MVEILGWLLCAIGSFCAIKVMTTSTKHHPYDYDRRSIYEKENNHASDVGGYVFIGLICIFLGMYLVGMFDK